MSLYHLCIDRRRFFLFLPLLLKFFSCSLTTGNMKRTRKSRAGMAPLSREELRAKRLSALQKTKPTIIDLTQDSDSEDEKKPRPKKKTVKKPVKELFECNICYENISRRGRVLSCSHKFHKKCINEWRDTCIRNGNPVTCPTCRTPF